MGTTLSEPAGTAREQSSSIPAGRTPGRKRTFLALIFAAWLLIYVPGIASPPLLDDADSVHAEAAREMVVRGDYVTLHANGVRYLEKAPLPYWLTAASYRVFGVSEFSTRLPLALLVLALLLSLCSLGSHVYGEEAGFYAALVTVTAVGPYIFTRFFIPDIVVGLGLTLSADLFLRTLNQEPIRRTTCWALAAIIALNVLTKGLIGLVFPLGMIVIYLLLTGDLRRLGRMHLLSSTLVFLAVAAPWHVLAALRNPPAGEAKGFLWLYFLNEHLYRYLNKRIPHDYDKVPLLLFWGLLAVWLLPWSAFLPQAVKLVPRRLRQLSDERQRASLLAIIWALLILVFFSFSTRQEYYVIPAVPALALLLGAWLAREAESEEGNAWRRSGQRSASVLFAVGLLAFATSVFFAVYSPTPPPGADLADLLKENPGMYALSMGHLFDLTTEAMGVFRWPLLGTGVALLMGTGLSWLWRRQDAPRRANLALAVMMCAVLYFVHVALGTFSPVLGSKPLALAIKQHYRPGEVIVFDGEYTTGSTINFYTGVQVHLLNGRVNDMWFGSLYPDAPKIFEDDASFARLWSGPQRVYFFTRDPQRRQWLEQLGGAYEVARAGGKAVFTNRSWQAPGRPGS